MFEFYCGVVRCTFSQFSRWSEFKIVILISVSIYPRDPALLQVIATSSKTLKVGPEVLSCLSWCFAARNMLRFERK